VRSGNPTDPVRFYTVEPGKTLAGSWNVGSPYHLSVYGPNGFVRYFNGSIGPNAAALDVRSSYDVEGSHSSIAWKIANVAAKQAQVTVLDAYTGRGGACDYQGAVDSPKTATQVPTGAWITPLAAPGSAIYELHTDLSNPGKANAYHGWTEFRRSTKSGWREFKLQRAIKSHL
jgi:phospholipase C